MGQRNKVYGSLKKILNLDLIKERIENEYDALKPYAAQLESSIVQLKETTGYLFNLAMEKGPKLFLSEEKRC